MLCYWIVRRPDGSPAGLIRVRNDRVRLLVSAPIEGHFTLFSKTDAVPIVPESETVLSCPEAVLGTDGDRVTCFAAADSAASLAVYQNRLSCLRTILEQKPVLKSVSSINEPFLSHVEGDNLSNPPDSEIKPDSISQFSRISVDSVSDSAREAQAFSLLLKRAEAFYAAYDGNLADNMVQKEDSTADATGGIDLFSREFPGARWRYVDGTDVLPHYEGTWRQPNGPTLHILAVRGHAAPRPPRSLLGFTRYLRDQDGTGYWLRLTPLP